MMTAHRFAPLLCAAALCASPALAGGVLYVDDDAAPGGDGSSWATAHAFVQDALAAAADPGSGIDEIRIAQGTYRPDRDAASPAGTGDREASFVLVSAVALRGGYAGIGAPDPDARDPMATPSVLSGDLAGDDGPGFVNTSENAYNVVTASEAGAGTIVDGVMIAAGNANGPQEGELRWIRGGGVWNQGGAPTFTNCVFEANQADWNGGGLCNYGDSPATVTDCVFRSNRCLPRYGGGLYSYASSPTISGCTFEANEARMGGGMFHHTEVVTVTDCVFSGNLASEDGGALRTRVSEITLLDCTFSGNEAGSDGGAVSIDNGDVSMTACTFSGNAAVAGGGLHLLTSPPYRSNRASLLGCTFTLNIAEVAGAVRGYRATFFNAPPGILTLRECSFTANEAAVSGAIAASKCTLMMSWCSFVQNCVEFGAGAMSFGEVTGRASHCSFVRNEAFDGGAVVGIDELEFVNCTFSRNRAAGTFDGIGASALVLGGAAQFSGCTFSGNDGGSFYLASAADITLSNCIMWGNGDHEIYLYDTAQAELLRTNIEGGWSGPGSGNMDIDPLFVQPGTDNVRLAFGSPCIDAGDDALLPLDLADVDGDGDTLEATPLDLDALPRVVGAAVDLGAYEGEHEPTASASSDSVNGIDRGESVLLDPSGAGDFYQGAAVLFTNVSGPDDAFVEATWWSTNLHLGAGGYTPPLSALVLETSLAPGELLATIFIPFGAADVEGGNPLALRATTLHPQTLGWSLAVASNTVSSPGFSGPIGDSLTFIVGQGGDLPSTEAGDYGVSWDPQAQRGYVWATVDSAGDFGYGVPLCPSDCRQPPDTTVGIDDLVTLLTSWGDLAGHGPCDIDFDGSVGADDLIALIDAWGDCADPVIAGPPSPRRPRAVPQGISSVEEFMELMLSDSPEALRRVRDRR